MKLGVRDVTGEYFVEAAPIEALGLSQTVVAEAIAYAYGILDAIDAVLTDAGETRLAGLLELANLSAVLGNLLRAGIAKASNGAFRSNGPHKYPDLLSQDSKYGDIEIKVALEKNKPKGHLAKPGPHITVRYVLANSDGRFRLGKENRGDVVWIWEIRAGYLEENHFSLSNTPGDSGKTAVINGEGMASLHVIFCDIERCPYPPRGKTFASYGLLKRRLL